MLTELGKIIDEYSENFNKNLEKSKEINSFLELPK